MNARIQRFLSILAVLLLVASPAFAQEAEEDSTAQPNIVETALQGEQFSTLVKALQAADLAETLTQDGPFTVFAPTNEAFAALPEGTLENLLKPENKEQLRAILLYHVVAGAAVTSGEVTGLDSVQTAQGANLNVATTEGQVRLEGQTEASVAQADVQASNGVIHVIDAVLLPPEKEEGDM